jgi:uncharacterized membrane protein
MAGIGFELRKLTERDDLLGLLQGYTHSAVASAGPWLFTILSLGSILVYGSLFASAEELSTFRLIIIYNFAFSLVFSSPVVIVATRVLADLIYEKRVQEAPSVLLGNLLLLYFTQLWVAAPFYLFYVQVDWGIRLAALANFFLITGIWLAGIFLTALKDYGTVTTSFAFGMALAATGTALLARYFSVAGMLAGFSLGLAYILFSLIARVFAEYPSPVFHPFRSLNLIKKYWEIALSGLIYNVAIWVDKWVMWFAPGREVLSSRMVSYPDYDTAMFLAYLTIVPSMAVFVLHIETGFFEKYLRFYRDIQNHANYTQVLKNQNEIIRNILGSMRNLIVLQGSICFLTVLLAPRIFELMNFSFVQLGMFRFGVMGAFFHVLLLVVTILLSYFDLRRAVLGVHSLFLLTNLGFSFLGMKMGFAYYGYGYFLSTLVTFVVAFSTLAHYVVQLPYQTFVRNNTSLQYLDRPERRSLLPASALGLWRRRIKASG